MGAFSQWILHEDQKELFDSLYATALSIVFFGLAALALWPLGSASVVWRLVKGYWLFCVALPVTALLLLLFRRVFRVDLDTHFDAYVLSALAVSGFVQAGWSAFAALVVRDAAGAATWPAAAALYAVGFLSSYVASAVVAVYYSGRIYRYVNIPLACAGFVLFGLWPAAARAVYGWFFDLFR